MVLYYGFTIYAAYAGVKSALAAFRDAGTVERIPGIRDSVAAFEAFIGYPDFADRARRFGLGERPTGVAPVDSSAGAEQTR